MTYLDARFRGHDSEYAAEAASWDGMHSTEANP
jgi:hypothetical protein